MTKFYCIHAKCDTKLNIQTPKKLTKNQHFTMNNNKLEYTL